MRADEEHSSSCHHVEHSKLGGLDERTLLLPDIGRKQDRSIGSVYYSRIDVLCIDDCRLEAHSDGDKQSFRACELHMRDSTICVCCPALRDVEVWIAYVHMAMDVCHDN
jgi:hypothetical protein